MAHRSSPIPIPKPTRAQRCCRAHQQSAAPPVPFRFFCFAGPGGCSAHVRRSLRTATNPVSERACASDLKPAPARPYQRLHQTLTTTPSIVRDAGPGREGKGREGKGREGKGREGKGREGKGREGKGREGKGREGKGREGKGREGKGREGKGREGKGREGKGREGKGREGKGREGKGREGKGREGKGREGKGREGKGREGKGREGKGREGKGREGKGREGKGREGKGREGKGRMGSRGASHTRAEFPWFMDGHAFGVAVQTHSFANLPSEHDTDSVERITQARTISTSPARLWVMDIHTPQSAQVFCCVSHFYRK